MITPGIFILSTQTLPAALFDTAAAGGVQLDAMAFIRVALLPVNELPEGASIAMFTSQHAVEALPAIGADWCVFCLEGATRRAVESRWGVRVVRGTASSAEELANLIIDTEVGKEVIFFCGDLRREELPRRLREAGFTVQEQIVYRTLLTPQRLKREYAAIAFFSPSGVESFFSVNTVTDTTILFAIGQTTASALRARTGRDPMIASRPDKELLIHEMIAYFKA
jgi:uroporphyrinogen-III synthase